MRPPIHSAAPSGESTPLLGSRHASMTGVSESSLGGIALGPGISSRALSETLVYPLIHQIRIDVLSHIDTPLTYDQLLSPESTYTIVRPLTDKYLELQNQSVVFCLLLNKVQFERDSQKLSISTLSVARATLCEILAVRVLRGWSERSLPLATVLLTPWAIFQGASDGVVERAKEEGDGDLLAQTGNALEMAIVSSSKRFIRSPSCQKVIEGIWSGRIIYSASNARAFIADNYKKRPIQMYNPHKAPLLDHYRLKVPKIRSFIEYTNFIILFCLYVLAMEGLEDARMNWREVVFIVYALDTPLIQLAFSLDKLAAVRERGVKVFSSSLVNGFDLTFMLIYGVYLGARLYGFHNDNADALRLGADWLAIGAVLIFPRLAFVTLANNLMVLSIRSMLTEFFFLMGVAVFCFSGFLYALFTLSGGRFELTQIGWWLLEVYFGLDASGFESAHEFHPFLGPLLMVSYALLSNTLLLTVLVAILGNTFATINADAAAESMFRKAVSTLEGVKADAVFSYSLPFNIVAVIVMWPMRYILNPRWFHKLNVTMIRVTNLPVLLIIALYERQRYNDQTLLEQIWDFLDDRVGYLPRKLRSAAGFDGFTSSQDIGYVFEIEREAGSFYVGWDEDVLEEPENLVVASTPTDPCRPSSESTPAQTSTRLGSLGLELLHADCDQVVESPSNSPFRMESATRQNEDRDIGTGGRSRATSMPSQPPSPTHRVSVYPTGPRARPRRNSSIHEPSPLARLFVRSPDRTHQRRQSVVQALMPGSTSHASISDLLRGKTRKMHGRSESLPHHSPIMGQAGLGQGTGTGLGMGLGIGTIMEGQQVSDVTDSRDRKETLDSRESGSTNSTISARPPAPNGKKGNGKGKGVRFPSSEDHTQSAASSDRLRSTSGSSATAQAQGQGKRWVYPRGSNHSGEVSTLDSNRNTSLSAQDLIDLSDAHAHALEKSAGAGSRREVSESSTDEPGPTGNDSVVLLAKASDIEEGAIRSPEPGHAALPTLMPPPPAIATATTRAGVPTGIEDDVWRRKIDDMDARQRRIEAMLERLVKGIDGV